MSEAILITETQDRVRLVTLNRPDSRNALSGALIKALRIALASADADPDVDVIVLTGTDPAFCAGIDLNELAAPDDEWAGDWDGIDDVPPGYPWRPTVKPIVGAVNGAAVTAGLEVALACDLLVASERAGFADTHGRVGVVPGWGLTARLADAVGHGMALRMSLTCGRFSAEDALIAGLVTQVVKHDELVPTAHAIATEISRNWRTGGEQLHRLYREAKAERLTRALAVEKDHFERWMAGGALNNDRTE